MALGFYLLEDLALAAQAGQEDHLDLPDQVVPAVQVDQVEKAQITGALQQILLIYLL